MLFHSTGPAFDDKVINTLKLIEKSLKARKLLNLCIQFCTKRAQIQETAHILMCSHVCFELQEVIHIFGELGEEPRGFNRQQTKVSQPSDMWSPSIRGIIYLFVKSTNTSFRGITF